MGRESLTSPAESERVKGTSTVSWHQKEREAGASQRGHRGGHEKCGTGCPEKNKNFNWGKVRTLSNKREGGMALSAGVQGYFKDLNSCQQELSRQRGTQRMS